MPYGVDKKLGGDNPSNVKWMEKCVSRVQGTKDKQGHAIDKGRAIAICKATLKKSRQKNAKSEMLEINFDEANLLISYQLATKEYLDTEEE